MCERRASIFLIVWTLIAVTLLSALAPLGPPQSRSRGSAFNPATAEVVLKARATAAARKDEAARAERKTAPAILLACLLSTFLVAAAAIGQHRPLPAAVPSLIRRLSQGRQARAPPGFPYARS